LKLKLLKNKMLERIESLSKEIDSIEIKSNDEAEKFRLTYLSKKGLVSLLFNDFKNVAPEAKREIGEKLNRLKIKANEKLKSSMIQSEDAGDNDDIFDYTLPGDVLTIGTRHPVSLIRAKIINIFSKLGFSVNEGPEIEDDYHVFTALNFPLDHPARDMQDTFFIEKDPDILLRTHTSSVQIRVMENQKPPIRSLFPGRVFRNEAISARSHCIFHQVEGLYIDKKVSFADLKQTLLFFAREMFGAETQIRLRPSFFPFTEPSAEMDISCSLCGGKGCNVCKHSGWVEILGCGMVDPNVLQNCGIDPTLYSGFAFGMGVERIAMLKYQINDIRLFFENDVRFLNQF